MFGSGEIWNWLSVWAMSRNAAMWLTSSVFVFGLIHRREKRKTGSPLCGVVPIPSILSTMPVSFIGVFTSVVGCVTCSGAAGTEEGREEATGTGGSVGFSLSSLVP